MQFTQVILSYLTRKIDTYVEHSLNWEFNSLLDLDKKEILFLLDCCCLKLSRSIRSPVYHLSLSSIWNRSDSPLCLEKKSNPSWFWIYQPTQVSYISIVLLQQILRLVCVRKRGFLLVWIFEICSLQFGIVREVCCHLVLQFGDLLSLGVLQLLDLICGSLFALCAIRIWYL